MIPASVMKELKNYVSRSQYFKSPLQHGAEILVEGNDFQLTYCLNNYPKMLLNISGPENLETLPLRKTIAPKK